MRISDWSSDVCSSDLRGRPLAPPTRRRRPSRRQLDVLVAAGADTEETDRHAHLGFEEGDVVLGPLGQVAGLGGLAEVAPPPGEGLVDGLGTVEIGRASGRERVCQYG